jgi:hypothetical protein
MGGGVNDDPECLARLRTRTSAAAKISFGACNLQNGYKWIDKWNLSEIAVSQETPRDPSHLL